MPAPVEDRLQLLRATAALSAVYGTIEGPCLPLAELLRSVTAEPAAMEAVDEHGVTHRMWRVGPDPEIAAWLAPEPCSSRTVITATPPRCAIARNAMPPRARAHRTAS